MNVLILPREWQGWVWGSTEMCKGCMNTCGITANLRAFRFVYTGVVLFLRKIAILTSFSIH